jgi:hypothetical protein
MSAKVKMQMERLASNKNQPVLFNQSTLSNKISGNIVANLIHCTP